jgi:hypothetical protein
MYWFAEITIPWAIWASLLPLPCLHVHSLKVYTLVPCSPSSFLDGVGVLPWDSTLGWCPDTLPSSFSFHTLEVVVLFTYQLLFLMLQRSRWP